MCGIVCALNINQDSSKLRNHVLEMSKKLRHRGPDWNGIYCDENVILAHERLAIVDPKSGKQPLFSKDQRYVLAANGEIYNDLKKINFPLAMPSANISTGLSPVSAIDVYEEFKNEDAITGLSSIKILKSALNHKSYFFLQN